MKKIFLLLIIAIIFVSCTEKAMEENSRTNDTTNFNTDTPILPDESSNPMLLPNAETPAVTENKITINDAKKIAFENAGVKETDITSLETDTDREGNRRYYEIDFKAGGYEYEYDIDMDSGKILKKDKEID